MHLTDLSLKLRRRIGLGSFNIFTIEMNRYFIEYNYKLRYKAESTQQNMFSTPNIAVIAGGSAAMRRHQEEEKQEERNLAIASSEEKKCVFSQHILKESKFLHSWKDRYVMLSQNYLMTFKPGDKPNTHITKPTELVPLSSITEVLPLKNPEKKNLEGMFLFGVRGKDKHGDQLWFKFACKSQEDRKQWIGKIQAQVELTTSKQAPKNK